MCVCKLLVLVYRCRREIAIGERERDRNNQLVNFQVHHDFAIKMKKKKSSCPWQMVPINWDIERQSWKRLYNYGPQKKKEKTKKTYEIQKLGRVFFFWETRLGFSVNERGHKINVQLIYVCIWVCFQGYIHWAVCWCDYLCKTI